MSSRARLESTDWDLSSEAGWTDAPASAGTVPGSGPGIGMGVSQRADATGAWPAWVKEAGVPPFASVLRIPGRTEATSAAVPSGSQRRRSSEAPSQNDALHRLPLRVGAVLRWLPELPSALPRFVLQGWILLATRLLHGEKPLFVAHGVRENSKGRPGAVFITTFALRFLPYAALDADALDPAKRLPLLNGRIGRGRRAAGLVPASISALKGVGAARTGGHYTDALDNELHAMISGEMVSNDEA